MPNPISCQLRLMATTDLHMQLRAYEYGNDTRLEGFSLETLNAEITAAREEVENTLLLDNGDFLQGNALGDFMAGPTANDLANPMIAAMNALRYDAGTLGNHEFNYGLPYLEHTLAGAAFPMVCANVTHAQNNTPYFTPYVILERDLLDTKGAAHPIKIGIIGFVPPQIMIWDKQSLTGHVEAHDIVETAAHYLPKMRAQGADIIVALCHSGIASSQHKAGMENAAVPLAMHDIDAMICGHTHQRFPSESFEGRTQISVEHGLIHDTPVVQSGFWGSHLGLIDLTLQPSENGWQIKDRHVSLRENRSDTAHAAPILAATDTAHHAALTHIRAPLGDTQTPLHSFFCTLAPCRAMQFTADAQAWHVRKMLKTDLPILSGISPLKAGGRNGPQYYADVPKGPMALKDISQLYPFPNAICALEVTGKILKEWLEKSASIFNTLSPAQTALINAELPPYGFDVIYGVTYEIDVSQPPRYDVDGTLLDKRAERIRTLCYQDTPIAPQDRFVVATNAYRASGAGQFPILSGKKITFGRTDTIANVMAAYLQARGTVKIEPQTTWRFAPVGLSATYETSPKARAHLADITHLQPKELGETEDGFLRLQLSL